MVTPSKHATGLGRGLESLLGDFPAPAKAESAAGTREVAIAALTPNPWQPRRRFTDAAMEDLINSIREQGVLQPILVRGVAEGALQIVAGERRWRAAQAAGLHQVPVVQKDLTDEQALELAIIENVQRDNLTAIEEARGYKRLMDEFEHTQDSVGRLVGKSRAHVANLLRLLTLPSAVQAMIDEGALAMGHARALIGSADPLVLARRVVKEGLSVRQTEALATAVKGSGRKKGAAEKPEKDADTRALERDLGAALGLAVSIDHAGEHGTVTVNYKTLEQLDDVIRRLMAG